MTTGRDDLFPYPRFADDALEYERSRHFWEDCFRHAVGIAASEWRNWMNDPLKDGHPIFSKIDAEGGRGLLVQQVAKSSDRHWFKCWISTTGDDRPVPYLFVETFVSAPGADRFMQLIESWCLARIDVISAQRLTEEIGAAAAAAFATTFGRE